MAYDIIQQGPRPRSESEGGEGGLKSKTEPCSGIESDNMGAASRSATKKRSIQRGGLPGEGGRGAVSADESRSRDALVTSPVKKQKKNSSNESSKGQKRMLEYFAPELKEKAAFEDPVARQARIVDD